MTDMFCDTCGIKTSMLIGNKSCMECDNCAYNNQEKISLKCSVCGVILGYYPIVDESLDGYEGYNYIDNFFCMECLGLK